MRKKILRISQKLAKIGHFGAFQPGLPRPVGWREKKICQKVGQTCQQSSGVNKFHFYQKTFVSISHMLIMEVSGFPFQNPKIICFSFKIPKYWHISFFQYCLVVMTFSALRSINKVDSQNQWIEPELLGPIIHENFIVDHWDSI